MAANASPPSRALASLADADRALYRAIRGCARGGAPVAAARACSLAGEHAGVWLALGAAALAADGERRGSWARSLAAVAAAHAASSVLKRVIPRARPGTPELPALVATASRLSFPSSHAASSFAAIQAYAPHLPGGPVGALAVAIAGSRVFLGAHYPSDVIAGAVLGTAIGALVRS